MWDYLLQRQFFKCSPFFQAIMNRVVYFCKIILQHIKEYCQEAAIHGPQHIVNQRLAFFERLVL